MDAATTYYTLKTLHIIAFTAWMAGMFYLPRLYVYHTTASTGSELDVTLQTMEQKLLRFIMNPAMIITIILGFSLAAGTPVFSQLWFHVKMLAVLLMAGTHGVLAMHRKQFLRGENTRSERYYRVLNEAPTILLCIIVAMAVFKPVAG